MKTLLKSILIGLLIGTQAYAGLPPTSIQGQSDASPKTKFSFQVPYSQFTDLGGVKALVETGNKNVLPNASFENTSYASGWTITTATGAVETSNVKDGKQSAKLTFSASTGDIAQSVTPTINTNSQNWEASCQVKTTVSTISVCAIVNGVEQCPTINNVAASGTWNMGTMNFIGPTDGQSVGVRVKTTASATGTVYVDDCYVGPARNLSQVSQAQLLGTVLITGCNTSHSTSSTTYGPLAGPASGCTYTTTGQALAPSANTLGIKFASVPPGEVRIEYIGQVFASVAGKQAYFQFSDGTNTTRETAALYGAASGVLVPEISGSLTYTTAQSNVTFQPYGKVDSGGSAALYGTSGSPGVIRVWYFPSQSQTAAFANQQWQPTVTKLLSGSGTYTVPNGVSRIEVEMVGGGGGGGAGAAGAGAPGAAGGTTTFGTSLLSCTGGAGGPSGGGGVSGGAGGSCTLNSPAIQIKNLAGGSGSGSTNSATVGYTGGPGGVNPLGGVGASYGGATSGAAGAANTGAGGGGGGGSSSGSFGGNGGGAGGYLLAQINYPASSYSYSVGTGGTAGSSTSNGGAGGSGAIYITEYYFAGNMPQFVGSVTSNTSGQLHMEHLGITSVCTSTPCTIGYQSGNWVSSVTRSAAGRYAVNFTAGEFSSPPSCFLQNVSGGSGRLFAYTGTSPTTSGVSANFDTSAGTGTDTDFHVYCVGPR